MGLIKWIQKKFLMKQFNKKTSALDEVADEILKNALRDSQKTQAIADKILKANMLRNETNRTLEKAQGISDEEEDDDEEEEEEDLGAKIFQDLIKQFMASRSPQGSKSPTDSGGKEGIINNFVGSLTPEQKQDIINKFIGK